MARVSGVVRRSDLEGGFWQLISVGGESYQLTGGDAELLKDGQRVEVEGSIDGGTIGFGMTGPVLRVRSYRVLR